MRIHELLETAADSFRQALQSPQTKSSKKSALKTFGQGVKQGYTKTRDFTQELPYSKVGKAVRGISNLAKTINKGPSR